MKPIQHASLPSIKQLQGHTPQGFAGDLVRESQFVWRYGTTNQEAELSLTMPLRAQSYNSHVPHPIFAMNLPEGRQYERLQQRFAKQFSRLNEMAILSLMGQDQIGRISLRHGDSKAARATACLSFCSSNTMTAVFRACSPKCWCQTAICTCRCLHKHPAAKRLMPPT
jgi:HipA-like protein